MSQEFIDTLGLWLVISAVATLVPIFVAQAIGVPGSIHRRRRRRQISRLMDEQRVQTGNELEVDWALFKEVSKRDLCDHLEAEGWKYAGEQLTNKSWLLRFVRAETDVATDPGDVTKAFSARGEGTSQVLQDDPEVAARVTEIRRTRGFDPLSEVELQRTRERDRGWQRKLNRQVLLASVYSIVLFIAVAFAFSGAADWNAGYTYVTVAVPVIVALLDGIAVYKAVRIQRARRRDVGPFLDAYRELVKLGRYGG